MHFLYLIDTSFTLYSCFSLFLSKLLNDMEQQGLYLPEFERDNCGAGFICNLNGEKSHEIIHNALEILVKLEHRGAVSSDGRTGDGAGILIDIPHILILVK